MHLPDSLAWLMQEFEQDMGQDITEDMLEFATEQTEIASAAHDSPQSMAGNE